MINVYLSKEAGEGWGPKVPTMSSGDTSDGQITQTKFEHSKYSFIFSNLLWVGHLTLLGTYFLLLFYIIYVKDLFPFLTALTTGNIDEKIPPSSILSSHNNQHQ